MDRYDLVIVGSGIGGMITVFAPSKILAAAYRHRALSAVKQEVVA